MGEFQGVGQIRMKRTRISLFYVISYGRSGGLGLPP
jgi:hypothetical protein